MYMRAEQSTVFYVLCWRGASPPSPAPAARLWGAIRQLPGAKGIPIGWEKEDSAPGADSSTDSIGM